MATAKRPKAIYHVIVPYRPPESRSPEFHPLTSRSPTFRSSPSPSPSPTSTPVKDDSENDFDHR